RSDNRTGRRGPGLRAWGGAVYRAGRRRAAADLAVARPLRTLGLAGAGDHPGPHAWGRSRSGRRGVHEVSLMTTLVFLERSMLAMLSSLLIAQATSGASSETPLGDAPWAQTLLLFAI